MGKSKFRLVFGTVGSLGKQNVVKFLKRTKDSLITLLSEKPFILSLETLSQLSSEEKTKEFNNKDSSSFCVAYYSFRVTGTLHDDPTVVLT